MPRRVYTPDLPPRRKKPMSGGRAAPLWLDRTPPPAAGPVSRHPGPDKSKDASPTSSTKPAEAILNDPAVPRPPDVTEPRPVPPPAPKVTEPDPPLPPSQPKPRVPSWILQVRKLDLLEIAAVLGLKVEDDSIQPCPRCGDEAGAAVYRNKKGWILWRCAACGARDRGNVDLASCALAGEKAGKLDEEQKALLRQWFADQGWCVVEDGDPV